MDQNTVSWLLPGMKGSILLAGEDLFDFEELFAGRQGIHFEKVCAPKDVTKGSYDWILAAAALESCGRGEEDKCRVLKNLHSLLSDKGRLVILVHNRLGLSRFAGMPDPVTGRFFDGIEGYPEHEGAGGCLTRPALEALLKAAGFGQWQFYYPYPDLEKTLAVYSDQLQPAPGSFAGKAPVPLPGRLAVFREEAAFDAAAKDGLFPVFANAYAVVAAKGTADPLPAFYVKFSMDRSVSFQIRTEIRVDESGRKYAVKCPMTRDAKDWVLGLKEKERLLTEQLRPRGIQVNSCQIRGEDAWFEFVSGVSLEDELDEMLRKNEMSQLQDRLRDCLALLCGDQPFEETPAFLEVFGPAPEMSGRQQAVCSDADLIFANLLHESAGYTAIDYEWTFPFAIPAPYLQYRCLHYYVNGSSMRRRMLSEEELMELIPLSKEELRCCRQMEVHFQRWIRTNPGDKDSGVHLMPEEGAVISVTQKAAGELEQADLWQTQIGFENLPEKSVRMQAYLEGRVTVSADIPEGSGDIHLLPCRRRCVLRIEKLEGYALDGRALTDQQIRIIQSNARIDGNGDYIFDTDAPFLKIAAEGLKKLIFEARIEPLEGLLRDAVLAQSPLKQKLTQSKAWNWVKNRKNN